MCIDCLKSVWFAKRLPPLEDSDALRVGARGGVQLGEPPGGDRAPEAAAGDDDVEALGHR